MKHVKFLKYGKPCNFKNTYLLFNITSIYYLIGTVVLLILTSLVLHKKRNIQWLHIVS